MSCLYSTRSYEIDSVNASVRASVALLKRPPQSLSLDSLGEDIDPPETGRWGILNDATARARVYFFFERSLRLRRFLLPILRRRRGLNAMRSRSPKKTSNKNCA